MKTTMTLGEIRTASPRPCEPGWKKLIAACGTSDDGHVVDLRDILKSNGPRDAWWATRCLPRRERVALALRAARTVEHLSPAAKACNDVTERWLSGEATDEELRVEAAKAWEAEASSWSWAWAAASAAAAAAEAEAAEASAAEAEAAAVAADAANAAWEEAAEAREADAEAREAEAWKRLGETMQQWCDEQDEEVRR